MQAKTRVKRAKTTVKPKRTARRNLSKVKWCWQATETAKGWRLMLVVGSKEHPVRGYLAVNPNDILKLVGYAVFVHMKNTKWEWQPNGDGMKPSGSKRKPAKH